MKRLLTLIAFALIGLTANAQTVKTRTDGTFTQLDQRLAAGLTFSIPFGTTPTLNGGLPRPGSLFYSTLDNKTYSFDGVSTWTIIGGSSYTFSDGLTNTSGSVKLGGDISNGVDFVGVDGIDSIQLSQKPGEFFAKQVRTNTGMGYKLQNSFSLDTSAFRLNFAQHWDGDQEYKASFEYDQNAYEGFKITDNIAYRGLVYGGYYADFIGGNQLWIPPKRYVDSVAQNAFTFSNALVVSGNQVDFGAPLTRHTFIDTKDYNFNIGNTSTASTFTPTLTIGNSNVQLRHESANVRSSLFLANGTCQLWSETPSGGGGTSGVYNVTLGISRSGGGGSKYIRAEDYSTPTGIIVNDDIDNMGLQYKSYQLAFNTANDLWIPPKKYVDDKAAAVEAQIAKTFSLTMSSDGTMSTYTVAHGLTTPAMVSVMPNSVDACGKDINGDINGINYYAVINGANVEIRYFRPPAAGTNNLKWSITVK